MGSFRFIHAARLFLDHQLHGTGSLPEAIRPVVEDATLLAFDRVVESCLAHHVDLLLLAGDSIVPGDHSVRGPGALIRGCERLAEQKILVVISAGSGDRWEAWPPGLRWPANVVRLTAEGPDEVPVLRDGRLLAVVCCDRASPAVEAPRVLKLGAPPNEPFCISLCEEGGAVPPDAESRANPGLASDGTGRLRHADYRATGGGAAARTVTVGRCFAHDPGPAQGVAPLETGPRGCTLVSVDETGKLRRKFLPTAAVRFEQLSLSVTPEQTRDDLLLEMIGALDQLPRYDCDRLWLVAWNVSGRGPCRELLEEGSARDSLLSAVAAEHGLQGVVIHTHAVRLRPTSSDRRGSSNTSGFSAANPAATGNDLISAFERCLAERTAQPTWSLKRCLDDSSLGDGPWASTLASLIAEIDKGDVALDVRRLGQQWFAPLEERTP
ncbi:MAG: hypothetical protein EXS05_21065 [Planctomycetaceae bacterium]|nr:hypothetical protein [Planctomycetaceae bacterium]